MASAHKKSKDKAKDKHKASVPPTPKPHKKADKLHDKDPSRPAATHPQKVKSSATPTAAPHPEPKPAPAQAKRPARKSGTGPRRDGKPYVPGELLIPGGPQNSDEALYFFRGCVAAQNSVGDEGLADLLARRGPDAQGAADELRHAVRAANERFNGGVIEAMLPARSTTARRTFAGFLERVRSRRREIGAFLRGLDLGRTEVSHMDSHGEASLQSLMEWAARIEKMVEEGEEPENADYVQLHRGLDQLDLTTEAFVVDLELTLRRQRDRAAAKPRS